jgi:hypothetical protein
MTDENSHAIELADQLRDVLDDNPADLRVKIKAAMLTLVDLLLAWPAETRENETACVIGVLLHGVESTETVQ